jgi:magnesium transporter
MRPLLREAELQFHLSGTAAVVGGNETLKSGGDGPGEATERRGDGHGGRRAPEPGEELGRTIAGEAGAHPGHVAAGVRPEAAVAEAGSARGTIVAWLFAEEVEPREVPRSELAALAADDDAFVWIDLTGYGPADLEALRADLALPEAALRIALAAWQRPRLTVFGEQFFVTVTLARVRSRASHVDAEELDLFVGRNYLLSAHRYPLPFAEQVLDRAAQNPALLTLDSAAMLAILLDELLAHYERLTEGLQDAIEALEERALRDQSDTFLAQLLHLKRYVFAVYRLADQHRGVFAAFLRPDFPLVGGEVIEPYFRDVDERLNRLMDGLAATKESVNGAFELYVSQAAHRTNEIMKLLTMVSVILLPMTIILGFFGTNFETPRFTSLSAFFVMVAAIALITTAILLAFARLGWLSQQASAEPEVPAWRPSTVDAAGERGV